MTASSMKDWACNAIKKANNIWKPPADLGHVRSIDWGVSHEQLARSEYEKKTGNVVTSVGLCISRKYPVLAASPDGIMDTKVLEIKCPFVLREHSPSDLDKLTGQQRTSFCSTITDTGALQLKKKSPVFCSSSDPDVCDREKQNIFCNLDTPWPSYRRDLLPTRLLPANVDQGTKNLQICIFGGVF